MGRECELPRGSRRQSFRPLAGSLLWMTHQDANVSFAVVEAETSSFLCTYCRTTKDTARQASRRRDNALGIALEEQSRQVICEPRFGPKRRPLPRPTSRSFE
jgi:hypothetical protein